MEGTQALALTLSLVLGLEYGLKKWWEVWAAKHPGSLAGYICYRLLHLLFLFGLGPVLFRDLSFGLWLLLSFSFVLLGSLELALAAVDFPLRALTGLVFYPLNFLIPLALAFLSRFVGQLPTFSADYKLVFLFVFLAHPTNFLIRQVLAKGRWTPQNEVAFSVLERWQVLQAIPWREVAGAKDQPNKAAANQHWFQVGRKIGTLERWLILILILSNNVSALGLVFTAKSIVRYPLLGDADFAEYYLLGTLLSVVFALGSSFLVLGGI